MIVKKAGGKVYGATLTAAEKKAMDIEIQRQLAEYTRNHSDEIDAMFLWFLHEEFGFGMKRLRRVHDKFMPRVSELCDRYDMHEPGDDLWLCKRKLLEDLGIDIEKWNDEVGD